jgi:uncharacterized protein (TIGR02147 family)
VDNIYSYSNYRDFLRDLYEERRRESGFTYREFSRLCGMNSSSWLLHLIRGTKNASAKSAARIASGLGLRKTEQEFFVLLVQFTQARNSGDKDACYRKIIELKKRLKIVRITDELYDYYSRWYHPVIRSLVSKVDFRDDYAILARRVLPAITPGQARKSVRLLEKLGLIRRIEGKRWEQSSAVITTGDEVASLQVVNYHKEACRLARQVFDRVPREQRSISALTMGIGEKEYAEIEAEVIAFRKRIIEIARQSEEPDRVYQLNLQLFPVSTPPECDV